MKTIFASFLVAMLSYNWTAYADQPHDTWGPKTNGLEMSISVDDGEIKTVQPCILSVRYRNVSTNETFRIYEVNGTVDDSTYAFKIISPAGVDISPNSADIQNAISGQIHLLPPGQTLNITFNLSHLCNFDKLGAYKIVAKKEEIWSSQKHQAFTVVSNPLNVTVTH
jgi:hypothetical protein